MQSEKYKDKKVELSFDRVISVTKKELLSLKDTNQRFGCKPSFNAYEKDKESPLTDVDPLVYRKRAAGGHIHINTNSGSYPQIAKMVKEKPDEVIQMFDIIVGNTCVLIDRDKGNRERRKLYGRAGEYRLPKHGIEYRTLSNFWLEAYPLMSLVFGLSRMAFSILQDNNYPQYKEAFNKALDIQDVRKAINNNDARLALKNLRAIEPLLCQMTNTAYRGSFPFVGQDIPAFIHFAEIVQKNGLKHFWKQDPLTHWSNLPDGHNGGFSDFMVGKIIPLYNKVKK